VNIHVRNDWKERILHDRHQTVDHFTYAKTEGETHETLRDQRKTELFANDNLTVHADSHTKIEGKMLGKVGTELHIKAGQKVVIEAGTELTLRGGAGWIKLDPSGVRFGGPKVSLGGGGSPGIGSGANPRLPGDALPTDPGFMPVCVECLRKARQLGAPTCGTDA
jgi:type VI secretion system secreted protein VgrG